MLTPQPVHLLKGSFGPLVAARFQPWHEVIPREVALPGWPGDANGNYQILQCPSLCIIKTFDRPITQEKSWESSIAQLEPLLWLWNQHACTKLHNHINLQVLITNTKNKPGLHRRTTFIFKKMMKDTWMLTREIWSCSADLHGQVWYQLSEISAQRRKKNK